MTSRTVIIQNKETKHVCRYKEKPWFQLIRQSVEPYNVNRII